MKKIPHFKLVPEPQGEAARSLKKFRLAPAEIGTRHQLGGDPTFLQGDDWPVCVSCRQKMTFYAQLDSINDEFCIADCGMIYVFLCFGCYETRSILQSY